MHLLFFVTIWVIFYFFVINRFVINRGYFFFGIIKERERERERERENGERKGEEKRKEKRNELFYSWAGVVNCECVLSIVT